MASLKKPALVAPSRGDARDLRRELVALCAMTHGELVHKHEQLFGATPRTHNRDYLRRRIAYRLQEQHEGGLSDRALDRIAELAPQARARARQPLLPRGALEAQLAPTSSEAKQRDPRLPPPGTVLTRLHDDAEHRVMVLGDGFEYQGSPYKSLSKIAKLITGRDWNGYRFFFGNASAKERNP